MSEMETRNFAPPERMMLLCNKAIDVIAMLVESNYADHTSELYSWLSEEVGMTDDEIKKAGFTCMPEKEGKMRRTILEKPERFLVTAITSLTREPVVGFPVVNNITGGVFVYADDCENKAVLMESVEPVALDVVEKDEGMFCPNCDAQIGGYDDHDEDEPDPWHNVLYCPWCGQRLNWRKKDGQD